MKKYIYSGIIIIIIALGFIGYSNYVKTKVPAEIKIGVIAPMSGQYSFIGDNAVAGARFYQKEWNDSHPDNKLVLVIEDDAFDAKKGVAAYKKLTELDHVDAIFNTTSPTIDALYSSVATKNVPTVQLGEQGVPATKDSVFQVTPAQAPMFEGFGSYVHEKHPTKPMLLTSSIPAYKVFATAFKKTYGDIPETIITGDQTNAKTLSTKLNKDGYTDYIVIASPQEASILVKELLVQSKTPSHYYFDSSFLSGFPEYQKILGDSMKKLEGSDVLSFKDIPESFKTSYKTFTGKDAGIASDFGYEGMKVLVETKGTGDWVTAMQNAKIAGVTGEISFDQNGLRNPSFEMKKYTGGVIK